MRPRCRRSAGRRRGPRRTGVPARRSSRPPTRRPGPVGVGSACQCSSPSQMRPYWVVNCSSVIARRHRLAHLVGARPDVAQEHRPVGALADRVGREVEVDAAREGVGHAQRRRRQVGRLAPADAPGPRSSGCRSSTAATFRSCSSTAVATSSISGPGVADAGRAPVADEREPELVEVRREPGPVEVVGHDARAGRERGLHPRLRVEPGLDRLAREQPRGEHHARVRGVRAARDRGDHDAAVPDGRPRRRRDR